MWVQYHGKDTQVTVTGNDPYVDDLVKAAAKEFQFNHSTTEAFFKNECRGRRVKLSSLIPEEEYGDDTPSVEMRPAEPIYQLGKG